MQSVERFDSPAWAKRMSDQELRELQNKKQETRIPELENILIKEGFVENTNTGKNHVRIFKHAETGITVGLENQHKGNDNRLNNEKVAKACLAAREETLAIEELELEEQLQEVSKNGNNKDEEVQYVDIDQNLPNTITAECLNPDAPEDEKKYALISSRYPCVGIEAPKTMLPQHKSIYIKTLLKRVKKFALTLNLAKEACEIEHEVNPDGTVTVKMAPYGVRGIIEKFTTIPTTSRPLQELEHAVSFIINVDKVRLKSTLDLLTSDKHTLTEKKDGNLIATFEVPCEINPFKKKKISLHLSPQKRPLLGQVSGFNNQLFQWRYLQGKRSLPQQVLKQIFGIEATSTNDKKSWRLTHPLFDEIDFTIPKPEKIPTQPSSKDELNAEELEKVMAEVIQKRKKIERTFNKIRNITHQKTAEVSQIVPQFKDAVFLSKHYEETPESAARRNGKMKSGTACKQIFRHSATGEELELDVIWFIEDNEEICLKIRDGKLIRETKLEPAVKAQFKAEQVREALKIVNLDRDPSKLSCLSKIPTRRI